MKKHILFLLNLIIVFTAYSQNFLPATQETLQDSEPYSREILGFAGDLPSNASLEKYIPPIMTQGSTSSCTAFSTTYYALSAIYNMKFGITSYSGKLAHSFDPWFTYSRLNKGSCSTGLYIRDALDLLVDTGSKKLLYPPYSLDCDEQWSSYELQKLYPVMDPYEISKWKHDNVKENAEVIENIKKEIGVYNYPVVGEFWNYNDDSLYDVPNSGIWNARYEVGGGGHAMTIVGYDDYVNGGSFRVVNSWGSDWGDDGYTWIKYSDFKKYCTYVYYIWTYSNIQKDYPQINNITNYTRVKTNKGNVYEGQTINKTFTGLGILSVDNIYFIGPFKSGLKNGYFKIVDDGKIWWANFKDNIYVSSDEFGFAGNNESLKQTKLVDKYISNLIPLIKVREYNPE